MRDRYPLPLLLAVLALAAVAAYRGSFTVPFFFDDLAAIVENPTIRDLSRPATVLAPPANGGGMTGRPLVNLSLALNYAVGGTEPRGYHVFNLLLHIAAGWTLFGLVGRTLASLPLAPRWGARAAPLAFAVALLWLVHPLQTESVTCIIQRTEVLVGLFYLLTLYAFARAAAASTARRWPILAVAACAAGMASKEVMVSAPLLALLYDRTFVAGSFAAAWRARRGLHLALFSTWALLAILLVGMGGSRGEAAGFGLGVSVWSYLLTQADAIVRYLALTVWPHPLVLDYGTNLAPGLAAVLPQALLVVALVAATFAALRWRPVSGFLAFGFFAVLAPSSSVVPLVTQTIAEHRMYLPLAAVLVGLVLWIDARLPRVRPIRALLLGAAALAGVALSDARNRLLQDEVALWSHTALHRPANARAHAALGLSLVDRGRAGAALPHFARALALDPRSAATEQNLGLAHFQLRDFPAAAAAFRRALALEPALTSAHNNLGATLLELGDSSGAEAAFRAALRLDPDHAGAHANLARTLFAAGQFAAAADHYAAVLRLQPDSRDAPYNLGLALARAGRLAEAKPHFETALRLRPTPEAYVAYARFLREAGDRPAALAALETALRLAPDHPAATAELALLRHP